jgi:hypothetical protein
MLYVIGSIVAGLIVITDMYKYQYSKTGYTGHAVLFLIWGGLIIGSSHLALKKGREFVEGMILGAFGPLGFIIEVLLPPAKIALPAIPPAPIVENSRSDS